MKFYGGLVTNSQCPKGLRPSFPKVGHDFHDTKCTSRVGCDGLLQSTAFDTSNALFYVIACLMMPGAIREWEIGSWCSLHSQIILITGGHLLGEKRAFFHSYLYQTGPQ